jgi:hypothetical protein
MGKYPIGAFHLITAILQIHQQRIAARFSFRRYREQSPARRVCNAEASGRVCPPEGGVDYTAGD